MKQLLLIWLFAIIPSLYAMAQDEGIELYPGLGAKIHITKLDDMEGIIGQTEDGRTDISLQEIPAGSKTYYLITSQDADYTTSDASIILSQNGEPLTSYKINIHITNYASELSTDWQSSCTIYTPTVTGYDAPSLTITNTRDNIVLETESLFFGQQGYLFSDGITPIKYELKGSTDNDADIIQCTEHTIQVDNTPPQIINLSKISTSGEETEAKDNVLRLEPDETLKLAITEATSGLASIWYKNKYNDDSYKQLKGTITTEGSTFFITFKLPPTETLTSWCFKAIDKAGRECYESTYYLENKRYLNFDMPCFFEGNPSMPTITINNKVIDPYTLNDNESLTFGIYYNDIYNDYSIDDFMELLKTLKGPEYGNYKDYSVKVIYSKKDENGELIDLAINDRYYSDYYFYIANNTEYTPQFSMTYRDSKTPIPYWKGIPGLSGKSDDGLFYIEQQGDEYYLVASPEAPVTPENKEANVLFYVTQQNSDIKIKITITQIIDYSWESAGFKIDDWNNHTIVFKIDYNPAEIRQYMIGEFDEKTYTAEDDPSNGYGQEINPQHSGTISKEGETTILLTISMPGATYYLPRTIQIDKTDPDAPYIEYTAPDGSTKKLTGSNDPNKPTVYKIEVNDNTSIKFCANDIYPNGNTNITISGIKEITDNNGKTDGALNTFGTHTYALTATDNAGNNSTTSYITLVSLPGVSLNIDMPESFTYGDPILISKVTKTVGNNAPVELSENDYTISFNQGTTTIDSKDFKKPNIGSYTITVSTPGSENELSAQTSKNFIVNKAKLAVTNLPINTTKVYDGTARAFLNNGTPLPLNDNEEPCTLNDLGIIITNAAFNSPEPNAAQYISITCKASDPNYETDIIDPIAATITKEIVSLNINMPESFTYGDPITPTSVTKKVGDKEPVLLSQNDYTITFDKTAKHVGKYTLTVKTEGNEHELPAEATCNFVINPKMVTITLSNPQTPISKTYDGNTNIPDDIKLEFNTQDIISGDNVSPIIVSKQYSAATAGNHDITIKITLQNNDNGDYKLSSDIITTKGVINEISIQLMTIEGNIYQIIDLPRYCEGNNGDIELKFTVDANSAPYYKISVNEDPRLSHKGKVLYNTTQSGKTEGRIQFDFLPDADLKTYQATIVFTLDEECQNEISQQYSFSFTPFAPRDVIKVLYHNTIFVDNHYSQYTNYQWCKGEDTELSNRYAQCQYYTEPELKGYFTVKLTTMSGLTLTSCPLTLGNAANLKHSVTVTSYPNPAKPNQQLTLNISNANLENAYILIFNNYGALVKRIDNVTENTTITLPRGYYSGALIYDGQKSGFKIIVE